MSWDPQGYEIDDYTGQRTGNVAPGSPAEAATMGTAPDNSTGATVTASGDLSAPEGVSQTFWQSQLDDPANANAIKAIERGQIPKGYPSIEAWIKQARKVAAHRWELLPEGKKKEFTDQDAGSGVDPNSVPGKFEDTQAKIDAEKDLVNQDWEGIDVAGLEEAVNAAATGDAAALEKLKGILGNIKDPEIADYVGDYIAQTAQADPRDIEAQRRQLAKFESLSDPRITAEEKLMMELARRETEADLRGQRGALANNLQARGVYGSGSELTMNAMAQQEAAQRQALEMLGAQANAQKRAMESLQGAADLSTSMRDSSASESQFNATASNRAMEFNKTLRDAYDHWVNEQKRKINEDIVNRGETENSAVRQFGRDRVADAGDIIGKKMAVAAGKGTARQPVFSKDLDLSNREIDYAAKEEDKDELL